MRLLIEENQYNVTQEVLDALDGLFTLQDVEGKISVSYVGYYYNPKIKDVVFILPKVIINEQGLAFGKYDPASIINLNSCNLEERELKFLYEFSVWIHRAIVVFNETHSDNKIVHHRQIEEAGNGSVKKKSNTLLDVILALIRFAKENKSFFTFVLKNIHSGYNKINWGRTISGTTAVVQENSPIYLHPINKKRQINFDEELIVIFFSILNYVSTRFGFRAEIPFGFKLIKGAQFERYISGFGRTRLRQIKYKYFSDVAVKLWDLCYAFFDKAYQIKVNSTQKEYLLVKNFNIVFEAIIDELIGDKNIPNGLKEQADGKLVDHFYTYDGLLIDRQQDNDIYYIGDSKYYKIGHEPGKESVYKQYTYARNVIQWNLNLFLNPQKDRDDWAKYSKIQIRDEETEGYNVIPNFFISANINPETLDYNDRTVEHPHQPPICRQFDNRLYDRDTLIVSHYDVNFLFIIALYARNNSGAKESWKADVRAKFRSAVQEILTQKFEFYALAAHPDVDAKAYFKANFQDTLGKTYRPFENNGVYSLALDRGTEFKKENDALLAHLAENFYVVPCPLGEDPSHRLEQKRVAVGTTYSQFKRRGVFMVMMENFVAKSKSFAENGKIAVPVRYTEDGMELLANAANIASVLFHTRHSNGQRLYELSDNIKFVPKDNIPPEYYLTVRNPAQPNPNEDVVFLYALLDLDLSKELDASALDCQNKPAKSQKERYDAQYSTIEDLQIK